MGLVQSVLADVVSDKTSLHRDDDGTLRRCTGNVAWRDLVPVDTCTATAIDQLLAAHHLHRSPPTSPTCLHATGPRPRHRAHHGRP
jgi:hypothetical protein